MDAIPMRTTDPSENQLRVVYSLIKPMVRMAARFGIPVRTLGDLVKLAYFEHLRRDRDMSHAAIGARMGQTERSMRSLEQRLRSDFFAAESQVGLLRSIEDALAGGPRTLIQLQATLKGWDPAELHAAVAQLLREERICQDAHGSLALSRRYVTLTSSVFPQRIDALNHHLDCLYQAVVQRLLHDERAHTMIKTISFHASESTVSQLTRRLEEWLRQEVAHVEEQADGEPVQRFALGVTLAQASLPGSAEPPNT